MSRSSLLSVQLSAAVAAGAFVTASAAPPPVAKEKWFSIKALGEAQGAELRLRGYVGEASTGRDYWSGETYSTGGMGTLQEFEEALLALGKVSLLTVYLTSEGGDFPTAIAISSILARQDYRIVCVIDGYAYSAAPVIACAADEVRCAKNALIMIHDTEFWCAGSDIAALQQHIATLQACNDSMAAAFVNKAGGTAEEWMARMVATTWMTGEQAHALGLVDVLTDDVALSAYQPLKGVTAALKAPAKILALIDTADSTNRPTAATNPHLTTPMLRHRLPLLTAASEVPPTPVGGAPAPSPAPAPAVTPPPAAPAAGGAPTLDAITAAMTGVVTAAVKPLQDQITAQAAEIAHLKGVKDHGLGGGAGPTAAAPAPVVGAQPAAPAPMDTSKMTAAAAIALGRKLRADAA